ncbi:energy-coupling factor ABC transporter ATP-binding protein [Paenibacillus sp. sgz500958]|uniref:energy-coupling factor ABC transporter ATP-binding protein n=1 Tax=Paenibacillus sp. sgz500958 TaxID=3242475 RepID=UPI0036D34314
MIKDSILELKDVIFRYPDAKNPALDRLSLSIPKGCKTAVLGHNGSGKSTLFLHMVGILRPQNGVVIKDGRELSYARKELAVLRSRIGLAFQDPEQQLILNTPLEDVSFGLSGTGMNESSISEKCAAALEMLNMSEFGDQPIHQLSLGQKKRTALAGILAMEPEMILLDEPTSYLDPLSEALLLKGLEAVHQKGTTLVMATHDMDLAYRWADWIIVMDRGSCRASGTPEDIFASPEELRALGLELPMLADLWQSLPQQLTAGIPAPRSNGEFKVRLNVLLGGDAVRHCE